VSVTNGSLSALQMLKISPEPTSNLRGFTPAAARLTAAVSRLPQADSCTAANSGNFDRSRGSFNTAVDLAAQRPEVDRLGHKRLGAILKRLTLGLLLPDHRQWRGGLPIFADLPKLQSEQLVIKFLRSFTSSYSTPSMVCEPVSEPNLSRHNA
jgi:hypothetical protein